MLLMDEAPCIPLQLNSYLLKVFVNQADGKSSVGSVEETWENVRE